MGKISLNSKIAPGTTEVPNVFIDEYMPQADGSYVKVYLYLLRCYNSHGTVTSIPDIADLLENTERDILRAICYWEKKGLISTSRNISGEICSITFEFPTPDITAESAEISTFMVSPQSLSDITPIEALLNDSNFLQMKTLIEAMLERPINSVESNLIVNLYSRYNFSADLIIHLFEHCLSSNKSSSAFIEKIGMDWAANGIDTVEKAKEYTLEYSDVYYNVIKAFGITGRALGSAERQFIVKWISQYGYGADVITAACSKTLSTIHQQSFEYADKIISVWHDNNVHTVKDIELLNKKRSAEQKALADKRVTAGKTPARIVKNSSNFNFEQRDYSDKDYESMELRAMSKYLN